MSKNDPVSDDIGILQFISGWGGGSPNVLADIQVGGFRPRENFDSLAPDGGEWIAAFTVTFVFVDANRVPTDINNDGLMDVGLKEIYFNNRFPWCIEGAGTGCNPSVNKTTFELFGLTFPAMYSVETIAAHEFGHGISLEHFNKISLNTTTGEVTISPYSLMSTYQPVPKSELGPTDTASYCKTWVGWPNYP